MILVGLTGGVATGKSTVAKMFAKCGATVIDADELARLVVEPDTPAWRAIVKQFGKDILKRDRTVDRAALAHIVFHNRVKLRRLERIIHPRVAREQTRLTNDIARTRPRAVVIYEVPLLFEAGVDKRVDKIVVVTADRSTQIRRLQRRNHLARTEALRRIRIQMPLQKKRRLADYVLDGTHPLHRLKQAVQRLYSELAQSA